MVANSKRQRSDFIADRMRAAMSIMGGDTIAPPARPYKLEVAVAGHAHSSASWAKFAAIRRERWRQSGAAQQHVRNQGISGSALLALETTLMTRSRPAAPLYV
jgi:hypothetical protein